jgi:protein-S-isoprenylcysteine O-methyltransferase Ste14
MKLVDKIVAASQNPTPEKSKATAVIAPILVFFFVFPILLFVIPNFVLDQWLNLPTFGNTAVGFIIGSVLVVLGVVFLLWTIKAQREIGKGTPMPLMATQKLIIQKPYSYCRNPLAFGLLNFYFGISILIGSISSVVAVAIFSAIILAYIKFVEEKELEQRYGDDYTAYKQTTPFLFPKLKPTS